MILLLDIGNTRVKWGKLEHGKLNSAEDALKVESLITDFDKFLAGKEIPDKVLISNVAGKKTGNDAEHWIKKTWGLTPKFIVAQSEAFGVRNAYDNPDRLGADRWAVLLGVHHQSDNYQRDSCQQEKSSVCIVDCGSAVTFDVLTGHGEHLGGLIIPGLNMMREGLKKKIQIRNNAEAGNRTALLARNTKDAISSGTLYTLVAAIDQITTNLEKETGSVLTRIITGGNAQDLLPLLSGKYGYRPNLVLEGLAVIAQKEAEVAETN